MMQTRFFALAVALLMSVSAGCSIGPTIKEPLRIGNLADLSPDALGFERGVTTFDEARSRTRTLGLTGVADNAFTLADGSTIAAIGADYQTRIHVFRNGRYDQSIKLPTNGLPPYGLAVRVGAVESTGVLVVLYRDPLARAEEPPALLSYRWSSDRFVPLTRISLDGLVTKHAGMTQPVLVGNSFDEGVLLVARDRDGDLWDTSYVVKLEPGEVRLEPLPMTEALRCTCVRDYVFGGKSM